jgi:hypothetical protein
MWKCKPPPLGVRSGDAHDQYEQDPGQSAAYTRLGTVSPGCVYALCSGLGILTVLEDELITQRQAVNRDQFLAIYGLGASCRVAP